MAAILIEAESFKTLGGWVIDSQSIAQMGSAYIMAHGMGIPVDDAQTTCVIPERGEYTVWARTRDWAAVWGRGSSPGIFQIIINDTTLPETLGTNGVDWGWHKAGTIALDSGESNITLHDLTGFNGRCDALYLTTDPDDIPENDKDQLAEFRRNKLNTVCHDDPAEYDLAVAGGGIAGICTAVAALSTGAKVVLIQDRPVLGGCNSSEIRVSLGGNTHTGLYPNLGNVIREIAPAFGGPGTYPAEYYEDARKENIFKNFPDEQYKLVLNESVVAVEKDYADPRKITSLIARHTRTGAETRYKAKLFADCTGDAVLARMMGAEVMYGRDAKTAFNESLAPDKAEKQVMGHSVLWFSEKQNNRTEFPEVDWGIEFTEEKSYYIRGGDWECETGQFRDQAKEAEYIRDYGLMTVYGNWSYLKNHSKRKDEWANDTLSWVSYVGGKRESYRVVGDYVLNQNDIEDNIIYPDATAPVTWNIDLHFPDPENAAKFQEPFRSCAYHRAFPNPYPVPYRCLYAKDVKNLFLGGRHISTSHVAFAATRVMRILGMLGEVIGMAAGICAKENIYPRDIYETHFDRLKEMMTEGVPVRTYHLGGNTEWESYHFKDTGHITVFPYRDETKFSKNFQRIKELNETQQLTFKKRLEE